MLQAVEIFKGQVENEAHLKGSTLSMFAKAKKLEQVPLEAAEKTVGSGPASQKCNHDN